MIKFETYFQESVKEYSSFNFFGFRVLPRKKKKKKLLLTHSQAAHCCTMTMASSNQQQQQQQLEMKMFHGVPKN